MIGPDLVVERFVGAPPADVFRYLADSEYWTRWQGVAANHDPRPGGLFRLQMANGTIARGQFVELDPPRRVVFTWGWVDHPGLPPGSTTVEIELTPVEDGTLIRLTHRGLPPDEVELHRQGWDYYLPRLGAVSTGADPGPDQPGAA
jgi:uncharacterized protein YndB with AHSA1/START domain